MFADWAQLQRYGPGAMTGGLSGALKMPRMASNRRWGTLVPSISAKIKVVGWNMKNLKAAQVRSWLTDGKEIALLDVREDGQYGEGHLLFAVSMPYSRLELAAPTMIPRLDVPICIIDDGDGIAPRAAQRLQAMGYADVALIAGGQAACVEAGFTVFKGVNVPSKALGELAEETYHTPSISAEDLKKMLGSDEDFILLDGRTPKEYERMTIPGAQSCPNAELPFRLPSLVKDETTKVIVNCAGRTRSIIGVQSLRNYGFKNPIFALENGTQGWRLAGFDLDEGRAPKPLPEITGEAMDAARQRAKAFMTEKGVPGCDINDVAAWMMDGTRTTYLIDVRTASEYAAGHLPGSIHAPGGQMVQGSDKWVAVRGARIVLCDDGNVRAANTAHWLRAIGFEACVLENDVSHLNIDLPLRKTGTRVADPLPEISCHEIAEGAGNLVLIDLRPSAEYRCEHIDGAQWSIRPKLPSLNIGKTNDVVLIAEEAGIAELAAADLRDAGVTSIRYLPGNADEWRAGGLEVVSTPDVPSDDERLDFLFFVHDRHHGNLESSREYLRWEIGLVAQIQDWERSLFRL